jgi:hypothetical protein
MSTFERDNYHWRETYFVLFDADKRPSLEQLTKVLHGLSDRFQLTGEQADANGCFESLTLLAPDEYAALDISYMAGEEVLEQGAALCKELKASAESAEERTKLARLPKYNARFDLLHFEEVTAGSAEDELDELLDPSALLIVLEALARLTKGVGIDPQSGTLV